MKKLRWATHKTLYGQIASSACLIGGSAGLIFGISAGTFSIRYFDLNSVDKRLQAALTNNFYSQKISSQWNMYAKGTPGDEKYVKGYEQPTSQTIFKDDTHKEANEWWTKLHEGATPLFKEYNGIDPSKMELETTRGKEVGSGAQEARKKYSALVIDGATHTALDRSFNQSLYDGMASFVTNVPHRVNKEGEAQVYKPSQDNTQEFINVYREAAKNSRILCLAGFNHVTPLTAIGKMNKESGRWEYGDDKNLNNSGLMLIDGDIPNNQNMASILFRADQPAFLTALATCMYFYNNLDVYHANYKEISVAAYGGNPLPTVVIYMGGFQRGIEFFNAMILKNKFLNNDLSIYFSSGTSTTYLDKMIASSKYKTDIENLKGKKPSAEEVNKWNKLLYDEYSIKMIKLGDFSTHFTGSFAAGDAIGISKQYLNRGASAIIAVAGPQSVDTAQEIMNQDKSCIVIGVDSAMENSDYQKPFGKAEYKDKTVAADGTMSNQASNIIKYSAIKDMTSVTEKIIRLAAEGKNWDITNDKPWTSRSVIPAWEKTDEVDFNDLFIQKTKDPEAEVGIFNVYGFKKTFVPGSKKVLNIPTKFVDKDDGATYILNSIEQPTDTGTFTDCRYFNASTLKGITTLKISGASEDAIKICDKAFDYTIQYNESGGQIETVSEETIKKTGFRYIDLSDISPTNIKVITTHSAFPFNGISGMTNAQGEFIPSDAYNKGIIKFDMFAKNDDSKATYDELFGLISGQQWPIVEADPYRSTCSFGFKTCGNIENGLISISWDGWVFLLEALKQLQYIDSANPQARSPITFNEMWNSCVGTWLRANPGEGSEQFRKDVATSTAESMSTFKTDSIWHENYSCLMSILGEMFNRSYLNFSPDMTVVFGRDGKPMIPKENISMTLLDWLEQNMYFIC